MKPGDLIKIIKAYVKSDLNGSPTINVGSGSTIEPATGESEIPSIDSITVNVDSTKENQTDLVVSGTITGSISTLNFTNSKGQPGTGLRFSIKGNGTTMKVVLWGKDESVLPKMIPNDSKIRLLGVKTKNGQQGLEIHGNDSTIIEIDGEKEVEPIIGRILSISESQTGKTLVTIINKSKKIHKLNDSTKKLSSFNENDVIECMPSNIFGDLITLDDNSFVRKIEDDSLPNFSDYRTKISQIIEGNDYCIEGIVLKEPERREVQTKSGESIFLSQVFIGDDSAEIWLKGWREQADLIDKCTLGERFSATGINAKSGLEGKIELFLTSYSKIKQKN
jgi:replication factor A1